MSNQKKIKKKSNAEQPSGCPHCGEAYESRDWKTDLVHAVEEAEKIKFDDAPLEQLWEYIKDRDGLCEEVWREAEEDLGCRETGLLELLKLTYGAGVRDKLVGFIKEDIVDSFETAMEIEQMGGVEELERQQREFEEEHNLP